jgi:hypothetical protein
MRDLGLMQLDAQGRWIDTPLSELERPAPEEIATPPAVPAEWMDETFWDEAVESAVLEDLPVEARTSSPEGSDLQIHDKDRPKEPSPASLHVVCTYVPNKSGQPSKSQDIAVKDGGLPAPNRRVTLDNRLLDRPAAATATLGIEPAGVRFLGERQRETHP